MSQKINVNQRQYKISASPVVVVCVDGFQQEYLHQAVAHGYAPFFAQCLHELGNFMVGECVVPSFTNPNNISIVTGVPPKIHGINGNYFFDAAQNAEVMMNDARYLKCPTILARYAAAGKKVAVVTAKDKLRKLLGHQLDGICFSAEKANETTMGEHKISGALDLVGLPLPSVYSADLSQFVMQAGVKLMEKFAPDMIYLSTTDYIQHKFAPDTKTAMEFTRMLDGYCAQLHRMGARLVITADHGMHAKHDGKSKKPNILFAQDYLDAYCGAGTTRVILPITDPYVVHHGALGSFATIHGDNPRRIMNLLGQSPLIAMTLTCKQAAARFSLDPSRLGDVVAIARRDAVIGTAAARHDLSQLEVPLRSHGGISEQEVPILTNFRLKNWNKSKIWHNYDAFALILNH